MPIYVSADLNSCLPMHVVKMATSTSTVRESVEDGPHLPLSFAFPKRPFGKKNTVYRSFIPLNAINFLPFH